MVTSVQVIRRSAEILMLLSSGPKGLAEIVRETGLAKGTAFRILTSLGYRDLVVKDPFSRDYSVGAAFLRFGQVAVDGVGPLSALARPVLARVRDESAETVTLHIRLGPESVCTAVSPSPQEVRYGITVGTRSPIHVGAAGKLLLASETPEVRAELLRSLPLASVTSETITSRPALEAELNVIRRQGYALSDGERVSEASAISVPLCGPQGMLLALSVAGPGRRLTLERRLEWLDLLRESASRIEAESAKRQRPAD